MMKKFGKLLCSILFGTFALSSVFVSTNADKVSAATGTTPAAEEAIVTNMDTASRLVNAKLTSAVDVSFDSVRLTTPAMQGIDTDWYQYASLYFDLEKKDLSDVTSFKMEVRGITTSTTWLRWFVIDENGVAARLDATKATYAENGTTSKTLTGSDWRGIQIGGFTGTVSATPSNFSVYTGADGHYGTKNETLDWSKIKYFMADIYTYDAKTLDVGSLYATTASGEVTLFDMGEATLANSKAELSAGQYYFGSTPKYDDTYGVAELSEKGITATYQVSKIPTDRIAFEKASNTTAKDCWISMFTESTPYSATHNISAYNGMAFDVDMTGVKATTTIQVDMIFQISGASYYSYGTATSGALFIDENGVRSTDFINQWKGGIKGTLIIPFASFRTSDSSAIVTSNDLSAVSLRCLPSKLDSLAVGEKVVISNMKFINYAEDVAATEVVAEGGSIRLGSGTAEDPTGLRFVFNVAKSDYDALSAKYGDSFEMGILIIPTELLNDGALTQDNANALNVSVKNWLKEDETTKTFTGVLLNVPNTDYETVCTARAYVKIGNSYYYSQVLERSISQVAKAAFEDVDGEYYQDSALSDYMQNVEV